MNIEKPLTTGDIAKYCHVTHVGVVKWIKSGKLKAYATPGGHYRIEKKDFREFLNNYKMPIHEEYFNKDKKTKKIILYIEKLKDGRRFLESCKKSEKEIIAIKAGKTKKGSEAAISHTGSLATDFEIYKGVFKQAGIKIENSFSSAFGIKRKERDPKGKNITIVTNAGGAGALMTDYLIEKGYNRNKPYCFSVIKLKEGPMVSAQLVGVDESKPDSIKIGTPVKVKFLETQMKEETRVDLGFEPA